MAKATAIYPIDPITFEVLMAIKGRKFGIGKLFPYGGKFEEGETTDECSFREFKKETGGIELDVRRIEYFANIRFVNGIHLDPLKDTSFEVPIGRYFCRKAEMSEIKSTPEMKDPRWVKLLHIPWNTTLMMPGDSLIIPYVLLGSCYITGYIWQNVEETEVLGYELQYVTKETFKSLIL